MGDSERYNELLEIFKDAEIIVNNDKISEVKWEKLSGNIRKNEDSWSTQLRKNNFIIMLSEENVYNTNAIEWIKWLQNGL